MRRSANTPLKAHRLKAAREYINTIIKQEGLTVQKVLRNGPRYYVAIVSKNGIKALLKSCLFTSSVDFLTNEKFSREILFLRFLQKSKHTMVRNVAPHIYASGLTPRAWYLREYISGQTQNIRGGNVRFNSSFYTGRRLSWIVKLFSALQSIKKSELPSDFKKLLYPPDFTKQLYKFMTPHWKRIEKTLGWSGISKTIQPYFRQRTNLYNTAPRVMVHQEPYGVHFIKQGGKMRLIDWENIGWGNPLHDYVVLWMRASQHPKWQKQFRAAVKKQVRLTSFDDLWKMEVIIQSVFNVVSWHFYSPKKDIVALVKFSKQNINHILQNKT
ncbi:phosphotransferase [Patescibacteria group bacterium]